MIKRKLKKLHEILADNPDYKIKNGYISIGNCIIKDLMLYYFGNEIKIRPIHGEEYRYACENGWQYHESWFEPIKEEEKWFTVVVKIKTDKNPYTYSTLVRSKEEFFRCFHAKESDFEWIHLHPYKAPEGEV